MPIAYCAGVASGTTAAGHPLQPARSVHPDDPRELLPAGARPRLALPHKLHHVPRSGGFDDLRRHSGVAVSSRVETNYEHDLLVVRVAWFRELTHCRNLRVRDHRWAAHL